MRGWLGLCSGDDLVAVAGHRQTQRVAGVVALELE
jgi:hypothetical protein